MMKTYPIPEYLTGTNDGDVSAGIVSAAGFAEAWKVE